MLDFVYIIKNKEQSSTNKNLYIYIAVGVIGFIIITILGIYFIKKFKKSNKNNKDNSINSNTNPLLWWIILKNKKIYIKIISKL